MKNLRRKTGTLTSPAARAEHALLQAQALQLGQAALAQHGIPYETTMALTGGGTLGRVARPNRPGAADTLDLQVVINVRVNMDTTAVVGIIETK